MEEAHDGNKSDPWISNDVMDTTNEEVPGGISRVEMEHICVGGIKGSVTATVVSIRITITDNINHYPAIVIFI